MIGVYALTESKQRRHEIGDHLALGAPAGCVLALVISCLRTVRKIERL